MKTREPYVRVLTQSFGVYPEGTLGIVTAFVFAKQVKFSVLLDHRAEDTVVVPLNCLDIPPKTTKVAYLAEVFQFDPVLAVRATISQQIIRSLVVKLVEDGIVGSEKARCFGLLESAIQKKAISSSVAVHFMDMLRAKLSGTIRQKTVFSLN